MKTFLFWKDIQISQFADSLQTVDFVFHSLQGSETE